MLLARKPERLRQKLHKLQTGTECSVPVLFIKDAGKRQKLSILLNLLYRVDKHGWKRVYLSWFTMTCISDFFKEDYDDTS